MDKLVCIRTVFFDSPYDNKKTKWTRNKVYNFKPLKETREEVYLYLYNVGGYMETDMIMEETHHGIKAGEIYYSSISEKEIKKYFTSIENFRDRKITHLLNNKDDNKNDFI